MITRVDNQRRTGRRSQRDAARVVLALSLAMVALVSAIDPLTAQGFPWPWAEPERKPIPREPVFRPGAQPQPHPGQQPPPATFGSQRSAICLQLEQRLVQESQRGNQSREILPKLEADLKLAQRTAETGESQLDRQGCYEYFLFSKTLKRTRQCVDIATQAEAAKRRVSELDAQRQQILASSGRSFQDDIVRELARNNCGGNYALDSRRREGSVWQDEEGGGPGGIAGQFGALPYATYRTICVRLCDGYYFPISFATLPNHFGRDAEACQSKCAAPVELYYHQNPGGAVEQAVAAKTQEPYTRLKSAFRYRKEFVAGCSCKQTEFQPAGGTTGDAGQSPGVAPSGAAADRRAEALPGAAPASIIATPAAPTTGQSRPR